MSTVSLGRILAVERIDVVEPLVARVKVGNSRVTSNCLPVDDFNDSIALVVLREQKRTRDEGKAQKEPVVGASRRPARGRVRETVRTLHFVRAGVRQIHLAVEQTREKESWLRIQSRIGVGFEHFNWSITNSQKLRSL